tara:strand:+ start:53 stop:241 length:189 start_codon:yes stop_codon:yes gene_type:complete
MNNKKHSKELRDLIENVRKNPEDIKTSDIKSLSNEDQKQFSKFLSELMIEASSMKREEQIKN